MNRLKFENKMAEYGEMEEEDTKKVDFHNLSFYHQ